MGVGVGVVVAEGEGHDVDLYTIIIDYRAAMFSQTSGHKTTSLTVVFPQLSNVVF